ncbi:MAG: class I SAM-dependent methyltransferase [Alphaproteobacteria bacterium]|nr:class I SAM-dependent methyltransferase [Alphaproteobacteria bacterium]
MTKIIRDNNWHEVYNELKAEELKLSVYDDFLMSLIGNVEYKKVLDYGCGPGVIANALKRLNPNAEIDVYDTNKQIITGARDKKALNDNIIILGDKSDIKKETYDFVLCNLVLCIVEDYEAIKISKNIYEAMKEEGTALVGFCNPKIFNVRETKLDIRHLTGENYKQNHEYLKEKKEGTYRIYEKHRPIEWYSKIFKAAGFKISKKFFTAPYELKGNQINDFIIFKLVKLRTVAKNTAKSH